MRPILIPTESDPRSLALQDVDGNGLLDLVTANANGTISVLSGNGNATFTERFNISSDAGSEGVLLIDLDSDSDLDIVATNADADNVSIRINSTVDPNRPFQPDALIYTYDPTFSQVTVTPTNKGAVC